MSVEELREVFDQFDENGDGQLSLEEFAKAFRALYIPPLNRIEPPPAFSHISYIVPADERPMCDLRLIHRQDDLLTREPVSILCAAASRTRRCTLPSRGATRTATITSISCVGPLLIPTLGSALL
jgi:hypothetical protein